MRWYVRRHLCVIALCLAIDALVCLVCLSVKGPALVSYEAHSNAVVGSKPLSIFDSVDGEPQDESAGRAGRSDSVGSVDDVLAGVVDLALPLGGRDVPVTLGTARDGLDPTSQEAYDAILVGCVNLEFPVYVSVDLDEARAAAEAVLLDHPELYWADGTWSITGSASDGRLALVPGSLPDRASVERELADMDKVVNDLVGSAAGSSDYDVAWSVYVNLADWCSYSLSADDSQSMRSALIGRSSVCAGYSRAFQYALQRNGIKCGLVTGDFAGERHMWCVACLDGTWCQIDPTWGDAEKAGLQFGFGISFVPDYFGMTDSDVAASGHVPEPGQSIPVCDSNANDPFARAGLVVDSRDQDLVSSLFWGQVDSGSVMMRFVGDDVWAWAHAGLSDGTLLGDDLGRLAAEQGLSELSYGVRVDDELGIVQVIV